jgi:hypothetical protein
MRPNRLPDTEVNKATLQLLTNDHRFGNTRATIKLRLRLRAYICQIEHGGDFWSHAFFKIVDLEDNATLAMISLALLL